MSRFPNIDQTVALNYEAGGWATEGELSPVAADVLLADTGQLAAGIYDFTIMGNTHTLATSYLLQHRNAANGANLKQQRVFYSKEAAPNMVIINSYKIDTNERLRAVSNEAVNNVQCSIFWVRRV